MRLIDADAFKNDYRMADECKDCQTPVRTCEYDRVYTKMDFCGWLDDAPTIHPEPEWIPVSKRLPDKPGMYTVTDSKGDVVRFVFYGNESSTEYWKRCAKAWMPFPEPWKEEE